MTLHFFPSFNVVCDFTEVKISTKRSAPKEKTQHGDWEWEWKLKEKKNRKSKLKFRAKMLRKWQRKTIKKMSEKWEKSKEWRNGRKKRLNERYEENDNDCEETWLSKNTIPADAAYYIFHLIVFANFPTRLSEFLYFLLLLSFRECWTLVSHKHTRACILHAKLSICFHYTYLYTKTKKWNVIKWELEKNRAEKKQQHVKTKLLFFNENLNFSSLFRFIQKNKTREEKTRTKF